MIQPLYHYPLCHHLCMLSSGDSAVVCSTLSPSQGQFIDVSSLHSVIHYLRGAPTRHWTTILAPLHSCSRSSRAGAGQLEHWWVNIWGCLQLKLDTTINIRSICCVSIGLSLCVLGRVQYTEMTGGKTQSTECSFILTESRPFMFTNLRDSSSNY